MWYPYFDINLEQSLKTSKLKIPPESFLESKGIVINEDYNDARGYDWFDYHLMVDKEKEFLIEAAKFSSNPVDFESILEEFADEIDFSIPAEIGIVSLVTALNASGYVTVSSSVGLNSTLPEHHPYVWGFCSPKNGNKLIELAKYQPVGLVNQNLEGYEGFELFANRIVDLHDFAKILYKNR
ncbi:hypothetical protein JXA48_02150 [Candidatus Woesearchaeota archaeon]|nr:hypothetical protein [Candidatus Woesearchaeota archaeon]